MKKFCTPWYFAIVGGYVIENHLYTMVHFAFLPNLHVKRPFGLFVNVRCLKTISFITPRHFQTHAFLPTHFHLHSFQVWAFILFIEEKGFHKDYCGWRVSVTKSCILCWNFILSNKACPKHILGEKWHKLHLSNFGPRDEWTEFGVPCGLILPPHESSDNWPFWSQLVIKLAWPMVNFGVFATWQDSVHLPIAQSLWWSLNRFSAQKWTGLKG